MKKITYKSAGVDIDTANALVKDYKRFAKLTHTKGIVSDIGSFGGLFRPDFRKYKDPILVSSTDGVGTKLKVAVAAGVHDTVGQDLVNHCVNDILVQGARPLFFLDYIAVGRMDPAVVGQILEGFAKACRETGCALLGGETAEMPGVYAAGDYDVAGTIVGVVDRPKLLDGSRVAQGDLLIGLPSSGLHTNGYSLARKIFFEDMGLTPQSAVSELGTTVAEALLAVHRSYLKQVLPLAENSLLSAMAHITGGGFSDNIPRVLPEGLDAEVRTDAWIWPPLFRFLESRGRVARAEMLRVFNCGVGMVLIVPRVSSGNVKKRLETAGEACVEIGRIVPGTRRVRYV
jgi:phosphoribosylformylglycinamidine cyclo-ligase